MAASTSSTVLLLLSFVVLFLPLLLLLLSFSFHANFRKCNVTRLATVHFVAHALATNTTRCSLPRNVPTPRALAPTPAHHHFLNSLCYSNFLLGLLLLLPKRSRCFRCCQAVHLFLLLVVFLVDVARWVKPQTTLGFVD
jgi:hypothetical protein